MRIRYLVPALILALAASGATASAATSTAEPVDSLRVLNYNIHAGRPAGTDPNTDPPDIARTAAAIAEHDPDIVTLQEVHQPDSTGADQVAQLAEALDMNAYFGPADGNGSGGQAGNAILTTLPIIETVNRALPDDPDTNNVRRKLAGAKLDLGGGAFVRVFTTHLSPGYSQAVIAEREAQGRWALDYLTHDGPLLFTGDFNEGPDESIHDWALADGFGDTGAEFAPEPTHGGKRIDFVYARGITATGGLVPDTDASDHKPVVIDLAV